MGGSRSHTETLLESRPKICAIKGLCKEKNPKIRDYYGSGWVGPGLTRNFVCVENHPKIALNQYRYVGVVYHMYSVCIHS